MVGRTVFLAFGALMLGQASTDAQSLLLPLAVRLDTLISAKVGEPREFWVSLPDRYNESTEKYPVIYVMDGEHNFNSGVIGGVRHAAWLGEISEFIIVGIKNTNRSKDIFPVLATRIASAATSTRRASATGGCLRLLPAMPPRPRS